ncbi:hypothetical protein ONE63_003666 [Megalurothrips usitatus]|uniref:Fatty acyl-CoA reductase n=1 Tax=Megalurothrips usitatus TaxID=439358 RepID=A0AAV7X765_9NEOP|nr:hypothetical protein ONE63_003666 [Megalurothrips usitatus]
MNATKITNNNDLVLSKSPKLDEELLRLPDRISQTLIGHKVFITGGTGFMGKVLIEKILRKTPDVGGIYLLVRNKKGKDPKERIKDVFSSPLFNQVKEEQGADIIDRKIHAILGDVTLPDLGISAEDRQFLADNITVVYHMAATIRFDEALKRAVLLNVRGTKLVLALGREMKKLVFFAHVSTAYCHLNESVLYEKPYPPPADPHNIIKCMEWMSDEVAESMTKKILGSLPNTYAYTKALAEHLVVEQMDAMPVCVMRPSIVVPIWKEPLPGWTDNINGPTGLLIGAGKGVIRSMYCDSDSYADFLPVDIAVNGMLVATWIWVVEGERSKRICHMTSSSEIRISWSEIVELGRRIVEQVVPLNGVAWYPGGSLKKNKTYHRICVFFFHWVPAYFLDCIIWLAGHEPVLKRVQNRIEKGFEVFEYYANNQWDFKNDSALYIRPLMNERERQVYKVDGEGIDFEEYFTDCVKAARVYILKEMPDTIPAARRHMRVMYWVDWLAHVLFWYFIVYLLTLCSTTVHDAREAVFGVIGSGVRSILGGDGAADGGAASVPMADL